MNRASVSRADGGNPHTTRGKLTEKVENDWPTCQGSSHPNLEIESAQLDLEGRYSNHICAFRPSSRICTMCTHCSRSLEAERPLTDAMSEARLSRKPESTRVPETDYQGNQDPRRFRPADSTVHASIDISSCAMCTSAGCQTSYHHGRISATKPSRCCSAPVNQTMRKPPVPPVAGSSAASDAPTNRSQGSGRTGSWRSGLDRMMALNRESYPVGPG